MIPTSQSPSLQQPISIYHPNQHQQIAINISINKYIIQQVYYLVTNFNTFVQGNNSIQEISGSNTTAHCALINHIYIYYSNAYKVYTNINIVRNERWERANSW